MSQAKPEILPSILSADFARLGEDVAAVEAAGIRSLHFDVMDGRFVPNFSIGLPVLKSLRKATDARLDVHLMIVEPERYARAFVEAGADLVTVHAEAALHLHGLIQGIQQAGAQAGVALNPATPLSALDEVLPDLDLVLIMTVNPGFGGQSFIPAMLSKISRLRDRIAAQGLKTIIQVDGGIDPSTAGDAVRAGARQLVAGSAVYATGRPVAEAIAALEAAALSGMEPAGG
jgi:ribulose-phosphate 3-epimerase